jgi:hypothetical protein
MMAQVKEKTADATKKMPATGSEKISKYAQYLRTEYRKVPITNMRAVLK